MSAAYPGTSTKHQHVPLIFAYMCTRVLTYKHTVCVRTSCTHAHMCAVVLGACTCMQRSMCVHTYAHVWATYECEATAHCHLAHRKAFRSSACTTDGRAPPRWRAREALCGAPTCMHFFPGRAEVVRNVKGRGPVGFCLDEDRLLGRCGQLFACLEYLSDPQRRTALELSCKSRMCACMCACVHACVRMCAHLRGHACAYTRGMDTDTIATRHKCARMPAHTICVCTSKCHHNIATAKFDPQ